MMADTSIHLYTICWDEADMLGFFFRHYDRWVDRYVVYDDGSTDGSLELLAAHPKVEVRRFERSSPDSFCLSHTQLQDNVWKESRGTADWVIVTAIDEHLHIRGRCLKSYLEEQNAAGVTIVPALGFDMNHPGLPDDQGLLVDHVTRGRPRSAFNKLSVFDPDAVEETNFAYGRHAAAPTGDLRLPPRDALMLWHYKHLGFERNAAREASQAARLGTMDKALSLGVHYGWASDERRAFWSSMERESSDLARADFVPDETCVRPLWWDDVARASAPVAAPAVIESDRAPTVSVLLKCFDHAPFVRQTVESVLAQGFEDFEIVATDDASADETADILRSFTDRRIHLDVLPRNLGISGAMNATIARARGRYLAIINSDDYMLPDRLARQVALLDSRPEVALTFGQIRAIDDAGATTAPYNDFAAPLRLPDFSRKRWLRYFFEIGNCLCAPTAMIRREAYDIAGAYDTRLTNLQDFDMWVRMVIAGCGIHVSNEELSAFRIRSGHRNASAPSMENSLRSAFEYLQILRHFAALPADVIADVFLDGIDEPPGRGLVLLARAALAIQSPPHQMFGTQLLYDAAPEGVDLAELRRQLGSCDIFGMRDRDRLSELYVASLKAQKRSADALQALKVHVDAALAAAVRDSPDSSAIVPDWFDEEAYLRQNPDVALHYPKHPQGYLHWLDHGLAERRAFRTR